MRFGPISTFFLLWTLLPFASAGNDVEYIHDKTSRDTLDSDFEFAARELGYPEVLDVAHRALAETRRSVLDHATHLEHLIREVESHPVFRQRNFVADPPSPDVDLRKRTKIIYRCKICPDQPNPANFWGWDKLSDHFQNKHPDEATCTVCHKNFRTIKRLAVHQTAVKECKEGAQNPWRKVTYT